MNEHDFFKRMIQDRVVDDALVKARAKQPTHTTITWRKGVSYVVAACMVLVGTVFLIPAARAEVLSWLGISTPQDYLTADPTELPDLPEIEALISSPLPDANRAIPLPIDRTGSEAVNSEAALKVSDFFYEHDDISLGDAMFDGHAIYQSVHMNGLSGLYLLENYSGGMVTRVKVDSEALSAAYDVGSPAIEYTYPDGWIIYELPNGTQIRGLIWDVPYALVEAHLAELNRKGIDEVPGNDQRRRMIEAEDRAFLESNRLTAVAEIYIFHPEEIEKLTDQKGNLTMNVFYEVDVVEEDRIDSGMVTPTKLFRASLGTITVNMHAYQDIKPMRLTSVASADAWGAETVALSRIDIDFGKPDDGYADDRICFSKQRVSTEGLSMMADPIQFDALGIRDLHIRIRVPDVWTKEQREALAASLRFHVRINGESGDWHLDGYTCAVQKDGSLLFSAMSIEKVPYDMLRSIQEITFIPTLCAFESVQVQDVDGTLLGTLAPDYGEILWSQPRIRQWVTYGDTVTEFPQYAIVLKAK